VEFTPVFAIYSKIEYYQITDPAFPRFHWQWFIEKAGADFTPAQTGYAGLRPVPDTVSPPQSDSGADSDTDDVESQSDGSSEGDAAGDGGSGSERSFVTAKVGEGEIPVLEMVTSDDEMTPSWPGIDGGARAMESYITSLANKDTELAKYLRQGREHGADAQRGAEAKCGARYELLLRRGVDPKLVTTLARLRMKGAPPAGSAALDSEMRDIHEMDVFEVLRAVPPNRRQLVVKDLEEELLQVLRTQVPSVRHTELAQTLAGLSCMGLAIGSSPYLTGQEYWDAMSQENRAALKVQDSGRQVNMASGATRTTYPNYEGLKDVARGRIPDVDVSRALVMGGMPVSSGFGSRRAAAVASARQFPKMHTPSVDLLIRTLIESAWEAGLEPNIREIGETVCDANRARAMYEKMAASRATLLSGFQSTERPGSGHSVDETIGGGPSTSPRQKVPAWKGKSRATVESPPQVSAALIAPGSSGTGQHAPRGESAAAHIVKESAGSSMAPVATVTSPPPAGDASEQEMKIAPDTQSQEEPASVGLGMMVGRSTLAVTTETPSPAGRAMEKPQPTTSEAAQEKLGATQIVSTARAAPTDPSSASTTSLSREARRASVIGPLVQERISTKKVTIVDPQTGPDT
jgi:hypothetical protein